MVVMEKELGKTKTVKEDLQGNICKTFGVSSYSKLENLTNEERRALVIKAKKKYSKRAPKAHLITSGNPYLMLGLKVKPKV